MMDRQLFKETFSQLHASPDTVTEVLAMAGEQDNKKTYRKPVRMGAILALAAVLLMGSAFAAVTYKLRTEPVGDLALAVSVAAEGTEPGAVAFSGEAAEVTYYDLDMEAGWLPEGMENVPGETIKWDDPENGWRGGFSLGSSPLNAGNATFCDVVPDAESQEQLDIGGHEAFYIKMTGDEGFNQRMFISYPEYNAVLTIYIGSNVDRDTAVKFAENLTVTASSRTVSAENLEYAGKRYQDMANYIATGVYVNTADEDVPTEDQAAMEAEWAERDPANRAAKSGMADAHEIGESFPVTFMDPQRDPEAKDVEDIFTDLTVTVQDISVRADVSALRDLSMLDPDVARLLDDEGRLPAADYEFVVYGDGRDTPSVEVVATLPDQQLYMVAATVEVKNDTGETVHDAVYNGRLLSVAETAEGWTVTAPAPEDPSVQYDEGYSRDFAGLEEMRYWDLRDTESNGGNHIVDLAPGESVTIQMGFLVSECQLGDLWFQMNEGDVDGFVIHTGYVPVP